MKLRTILTLALTTALLPAGQAVAKVSAEKAAELDGPKYTCIGAEKAGSASGVAAYTGQWVESWPGMKGKSGYEPGPYANEKPQFTITAANMDKYADKLTEGQRALLKKYPNFKMNVYPSHRDFGQPKWVCDNNKANAVSSEIIDGGLGITGKSGGIPFPFPSSGLEAIWNAIVPFRPLNEYGIADIADVYANGSIAWGRQIFKTFSIGNQPGASYTDKFNAYFFVSYLLPERDKGFTAVGFQPNNFKGASTSSWQYSPGIRRVRQAPEVGFDYPVPPAGLRTVDDDNGFNGSPERYNWKLVGKKEIYVPYANFRVNDPALKYKDMIKPETLNPEYVRYELHRVWVIEGTQKDGVRHIYKRRNIFADEDTWLTLWTDSYDARNQLWRANYITYHYSQESKSWHRGVSMYHDLTSNAYEAGYLVNESKQWWKLNDPKMKISDFTPDAAARGGH